MGMIEIGDKVKVLYWVYEDENWTNAMDRYIDDGEVHIVTNDHGVCHKGIHRMSLDYAYAFPVICLELVAKGAGSAELVASTPVSTTSGGGSGDTLAGLYNGIGFN